MTAFLTVVTGLLIFAALVRFQDWWGARKPQRRHHQYIPPSYSGPVLFDSAQLVKALREKRQ